MQHIDSRDCMFNPSRVHATSQKYHARRGTLRIGILQVRGYMPEITDIFGGIVMFDRLAVIGVPSSAGAYAPGREKAPDALCSLDRWLSSLEREDLRSRLR
jgi:hypothetical protein